MAASDAPTRLGWAGKGVVIGGVVLAAAAVVLPPVGAVTVVIVATLTTWLYERRTDDERRMAIGVGSIGAIAAVEAGGLGLSIDLIGLGLLAILFGIFDMVASRLLQSVQRRATGDN